MQLPNFIQGVVDNLQSYLESGPFTSQLVANKTSKFITHSLIYIFISVVLYETLYWSGIYLGLWQYHAKEIFKEVPVHCAHVYVRVNVIQSQQQKALFERFKTINQSLVRKLYHTYLIQPNTADYTFFKYPVRYHFEFSPEDFEMNDEPEWGSTVSHLRSKILQTFMSSPLAAKCSQNKLAGSTVLIFNNQFQLVTQNQDASYLCKAGIETGNVIECFILMDQIDS